MFLRSVVSTTFLACLACGAAAQTALEGSEVDTTLSEAAQRRPPIMGKDFTVNGQRVYNAPVLAVRRLIFKPGSSLLFSEQVLRDRRDLYIFAEEVVSEDAEAPGVIGWVKREPPKAPVAGAGIAGSDNGSREGMAGGPGSSGTSGVKGTDGDGSPDLTLIVKAMSSPLKVDLAGGPAGSGGDGGPGGRGGGGGYGTPASSSMFDCKRGAGDGASGGSGGPGGTGGDGGAGGRGGVFTFIAPEGVVPTATRLLIVNMSSGPVGVQGSPGPGGQGGSGGRRGQEARPYCKDDGHDGGAGASGSTGQPGAPGSAGRAGAYFVGAINVSDIDVVMK